MTEMIKFGSIGQFRNTIRDVKDYVARQNEINGTSGTLPTLEFRGSVKLHGTNCSWNYSADSGTFTPQSRNRVLSVGDDNAGFAKYCEDNRESINTLFNTLTGFVDVNNKIDNIIVYGEWVGPGIQKGVAISSIPTKSFFVFSVKYIFKNGSVEEYPGTIFGVTNALSLIQVPDAYSITDFPEWRIVIDFNEPDVVQNELIKITEDVEAECPVALVFGVSGIGEGVVWTHYLEDGSTLRFKVKGEKHSISKVKTLAAVDIEEINNIKEFVDSVLTESRLMQGIEYLKEMNHKIDETSTGHYVKWVVSDVFKEEMDTINENGLDSKKVGKHLSNGARKWFFEKGIC